MSFLGHAEKSDLHPHSIGELDGSGLSSQEIRWTLGDISVLIDGRILVIYPHISQPICRETHEKNEVGRKRKMKGVEGLRSISDSVYPGL